MAAVAVQISPEPMLRFVDANGNALNGGKLYVYLAGTLTKTTSYTDSTGTVPQTNPIVLNVRGEPGGSGIWLAAGVAVKLVLSTATDTDPPGAPIWSVDGINSGTTASLGANTFTATQTFTPVSGAAIVVTAGGINEI